MFEYGIIEIDGKQHVVPPAVHKLFWELLRLVEDQDEVLAAIAGHVEDREVN